MKNLVSKLLPLIDKFKGKKPIVIILSVVAIVAGVFAVKKGYISEDLLDVNMIVGFIDNTFASDSTQAVVDTTIYVNNVVDSLTY